MSTTLLRASLVSLMLTLLLSCGGGGGADGAAVGTSHGGAPVQGAPGPDASAGGDSTGGSASTDGSTSTASAGGDDAGVGSGGTGVSTADASTSVGAVDGMGSIIVGGLRYDVDQIDPAVVAELKIGMSIAVTGRVEEDFASGTAMKLSSAAEMRGPVSDVVSDVGIGSFKLMGNTVTVDEATVWGDLQGLDSLCDGTTVQVWGLPTASGELRATRVETLIADSTLVVTGMVAQLDTASATFTVGNLRVSYDASASFGPGLAAGDLADGLIVRVRADQLPQADQLVAARIEPWYAIPTQADVAVQLEGLISDFVSKGDFRVLGRAIDASDAKVTGGLEEKLNNGVKVVASGTLSADGKLIASKLKIRHLPGVGALPSYKLIGTVGNFVSPSDFLVKGQKVDATNAVFETGSAASDLANGKGVTVDGVQVVNDVLIATQISFD